MLLSSQNKTTFALIKKNVLAQTCQSNKNKNLHLWNPNLKSKQKSQDVHEPKDKFRKHCLQKQSDYKCLVNEASSSCRGIYFGESKILPTSVFMNLFLWGLSGDYNKI